MNTRNICSQHVKAVRIPYMHLIYEIAWRVFAYVAQEFVLDRNVSLHVTSDGKFSLRAPGDTAEGTLLNPAECFTPTTFNQLCRNLSVLASTSSADGANTATTATTEVVSEQPAEPAPTPAPAPATKAAGKKKAWSAQIC